MDIGDDVHIVTKTGKRYEIEITRIAEEALHGRATDGKRYKFPFTSIESIEVSEISVGKTAGAILLTFLAILGLGAYAMGELSEEEGY